MNLLAFNVQRLHPLYLNLLLLICTGGAALLLLLEVLYWETVSLHSPIWVYWTVLGVSLALPIGLLIALFALRSGRRKLALLEQHFAEFSNYAADMLLVSTLEGHFIDCNRQACATLGYKREDLLSRSVWDLDIDCYLRHHPKLRLELERGETISYESFFRRADGTRLPVESRVRKAMWMEQSVYIEIVRDNTARKQAEDALLESKAAVERARNVLESRMLERTEELNRRIEERNQAQRRARELADVLEDTIDCMPSIIITVDASRRVRHWNQQAVHATGISAVQAVGKSLKALLPQFDQQIEAVAEATAYGRREHSARIHVRLSERPYLLDVVVYPLSGRGKGVVIRVDDVTEKVRIEQTLVQTEKMMSLGGLAAGMAHEINNPLGAILQSAQNIERRLSVDWPRNQSVAEQFGVDINKLHHYLEKQRIPEFLSGIREAGERAAAIVADMLSFARQSSTELLPIDLTATLDAAVRLAGADYNQKNKFDFRRITIERDFEANVPRVRAQKNQIEQVLLNLLINAAQALASQNNADPRITLRLYRDDQFAVMEIHDNGPGMEESVARRVFEPFFTTKDEGTGTGLGLSVSYFIVTEQLKGQIEVESIVGEGTRFRIRLPFSEKIAALPTPTKSQIELPL